MVPVVRGQMAEHPLSVLVNVWIIDVLIIMAANQFFARKISHSFILCLFVI
jgi:hypothetical protein